MYIIIIIIKYNCWCGRRYVIYHISSLHDTFKNPFERHWEALQLGNNSLALLQ